MDATNVLLLTAVFLGFTHTILGPDHYVPFVALSKANNWTYKKTFVFTFLCGIGHVGSSVLLGIFGIIIGYEISKIESIQNVLGDIAAWLLLSFGIIYSLYGIRRYYVGKRGIKGHSHEGLFHFHKNGSIHHEHKSSTNSGWILFLIFIFGPCEPLIPLLMYPAAHHSAFSILVVSLAFGLATIGTMLTIVTLLFRGVSFLSLSKYAHANHLVAGLSILACGVAVLMGL